MSKLRGFINRIFFGGLNNNQNRQQPTNQQKRRSDGSIHIDYVPKDGQQPSKDKGFKGGDYVDYEDV
ncbi:MAG: DUF4834 domain-containing protein [Reichenbachiella sp.]